MTSTDIRLHGGAPTLHIDGQPHPGCLFWHSRPEQAAEDFQRFAGAGVHLFTTGLRASLRPDGTWHLDGAAKVMDDLLAADPAALLLPRVGLEPPAWWIEAHSEEMQEHRDVGNGDRLRRHVSYASLPWRDEMGRALDGLIRQCEARWGDRMLGYHLCAGACGEWAYYWGPVISDYSPAQRDGFRRWLRERYGDDEGSLQRAWNDPAARFATVELPERGRVRNPRAWPAEWSCIHPDTERALIDYMTYHSWVVADAIGHFCTVAKKTLADLGRRKVVGFFYGYHFGNASTPWVAHNAGHHALDTVLDCEAVDFVCAPMTYHERQAGGLYYSQLPPASVRLHGKLYYNEDDTFTHRAKETPWRPICKDLAETANVLWRNVAGALRDGGSFWWMDHDGDGWYREDALMDEIAAMASFNRERLAADRTPSAQIALIVNPDSLNRLRYDASLVDALLPKLISELGSLGASYDVYQLGDLPLLLESDAGQRLKLLIFPDSLYLDDAGRAAIRQAMGGGRHLLFVYGAGLLSDAGTDVTAMAELLGMGVRLIDRAGPSRAETYLTGDRLTYGTCNEIGPELVGIDDGRAEVLGWTLHRGEPALLRRRRAECTVIWSACPVVPAVILRQFARDAGVHLYTSGGDHIWAEPDLLVLHAAYTGSHEVRLPAPARVVDLRQGTLVTPGADRFTVDLARGTTAIWRLNDA